MRVKICCISSVEEAALAVGCGAHALGLVGHMPSGPGVIEDGLIREIARSVPPGVNTFLLTCHTSAKEIVAHYRRTYTQVIQMVDYVHPSQYQLIRQELPHVKLVQVIHVMDQASVAEALDASRYADALLLDSGNPTLAVKELGGTGRTHNWELSRQIGRQCGVPVFLAGGLNPANISRAVESVNPFGVDICSGVRTDGKLDAEKLRALFAALSL